eukprot:TRINITY_DN792_c0_g1_i2.p1 TRINITY_DN792_c0_g1~~TRINITY_DN792_c0_g1_i2.p1  ORF type:complete len:333 (+),score=44.89 TRINITY_DN792_c0_g1_i2:468-1466(+)
MHSSPAMWIQFAYTMFFFFLSYYLGFICGSIFFCIFGGWWFSQIGIMIMHDGNHGALGSKTRSRFMGMFMDFMGASSFVWKHEHNIGHHQYTNSTADPDATTGYPFLRYNPAQAWKPYQKYQHLYIWIAYGFVGIKWYVSDMTYAAKGFYRSMKMYTMSKEELILLIVTKSLTLVWGFAIPIYFNGFLWGGLIMPGIAVAAAGYCFALQFVVTHLADDVVFPEEYAKETDWAKCQILTTSNYGIDSTLARWLSGGLNFQIEHHLFPTICHARLHEISPIVRQTCKEFNVPYFKHDSFYDGVKHHYDHLKRMSISPDKAVPLDFNALFKQSEN